MKNRVHESLECAGCITKPQGQNRELKQPEPTDKSGLELMTLLHGYLVVPHVQVNTAENPRFTQPVQQVINPWEGVLVQLGLLVQCPVVYTHP